MIMVRVFGWHMIRGQKNLEGRQINDHHEKHTNPQLQTKKSSLQLVYPKDMIFRLTARADRVPSLKIKQMIKLLKAIIYLLQLISCNLKEPCTRILIFSK